MHKLGLKTDGEENEIDGNGDYEAQLTINICFYVKRKSFALAIHYLSYSKNKYIKKSEKKKFWKIQMIWFIKNENSFKRF